MIEHLIELDQDLFLFLNGLGNTTWDGFWLAYTEKVNWIPFYLVLAFLLYKKLGIKMLFVTLVIAVLMVSFTDQITNIFKHTVQRFRPCKQEGIAELMRLVKDSCGGRYGYFSGHSSNSMGIAILVGLILRDKYKYLIYILVFWAILMGYSRIYIGVHYPLDVLSGFVFGAISSYGFYRLDKYIYRKAHLEEN